MIEPLKNAPKEQLLERLWSVVTYIASATEHVSEAELQITLTDVFRESEEIMMTIAEKWRQEGEAIGIRKGEEIGIRKGEEIGIRKGKQNTMVQIIEARFGSVTEEISTLIEHCDLKQLDALVDLALEVTTLNEFVTKFTDLYTSEVDLPMNEIDNSDKTDIE